MFSLRCNHIFQGCRMRVHVKCPGCKLVNALCHFYGMLPKQESLLGENKVNLINPTKQNQMIQKKPYFERGWIYTEEINCPINIMLEIEEKVKTTWVHIKLDDFKIMFFKRTGLKVWNKLGPLIVLFFLSNLIPNICISYPVIIRLINLYQHWWAASSGRD